MRGGIVRPTRKAFLSDRHASIGRSSQSPIHTQVAPRISFPCLGNATDEKKPPPPPLAIYLSTTYCLLALPGCLAVWLPPPPVSVRRPFQAVFLPAFGGGGLAASELLLLNACLLAFFSHAAFAIPAASTFGPGHGVWNWGIGGGGGWLTLNYCTAIVELEAEARISEYRCHSSASCLEFEFAIAWEGGSADQKSHQYASRDSMEQSHIYVLHLEYCGCGAVPHWCMGT